MNNRPEVHVTDVNQFLTCRTKWFYSSRLSNGLRSRRPNKHLMLGTAVHYGLGAYYGSGPTMADWSAPGALSAYIAHLKREKDAGLPSDDEDLNDYMDLGNTMLVNYFPWSRQNDDFTVIMPEVEIRYDFGDYDFAGTTDGVVRDESGGIWLLEHKTAAQFPNATALSFSLQAAMYTWVVRNTPSIASLGSSVRGVIFTILRKAVPTMPKVLKSGSGMERRADIGCTPTQYLRAVTLAGFDPKDYASFASTLDPNKFVHREYIALPEKALQTAVMEFTTVAEEMVHNPRIYRCDPLRQCSWCDYKDLCSQKLFGRPWEEIADNYFVKDTGTNEEDLD